MAEYHQFSVKLAEEVGVNAAILFDNICFWIEKNRANGVNEIQGKTWTYNSARAFAELFPYMGEKQIRNALDKLEEAQYIEVGEFNNKPFDHTKWYSVGLKGKLRFAQTTDRATQKGRPIPDTIHTDIRETIITPLTGSNNIKEKTTEPKNKRFVPPTIEEVQAYCSENNIRIDAEQFWYYYDSKNWVCGKTKMSRWKSTVRLWERNERKYRNASAPNKPTRREEEPNWL